jgi:hypothetical protein
MDKEPCYENAARLSGVSRHLLELPPCALVRGQAIGFRIVLAIGVRDRARGEFWRYLRQALTRHREKFAEAMMLAAVGYHFRKLTED